MAASHNVFWQVTTPNTASGGPGRDDIKIGIKTSALTFRPLRRGGGDVCYYATPASSPDRPRPGRGYFLHGGGR